MPPWHIPEAEPAPGPRCPGRTDYAINGGSVITQTLATFNGIACNRSQVILATMIPDNKETTYLIGEKYMAPENYLSGTDPGDLSSAMSGDDVSLSRWGNTSLLPSMDRTANNNPPTNGPQIFGSCARRPDGTRPFATGTCR